MPLDDVGMCGNGDANPEFKIELRSFAQRLSFLGLGSFGERVA